MTNIVLIGHGYWGKKLENYIPAFFNLRHVCNLKTDMSKVWDDVEAVIIATPIETHYSIAMGALLRGKHVFCEKPITLKIGEALRLRHTANERNLKIGVEYTFQFSQGIQHMIRELPRIGKIQHIEMVSRHLGRFMNHNVYWLLASHYMAVLDRIVDLDLLNWEDIDCVKNEKIVTTGLLDFWNNDLTGTINVSINYPGKDNNITIYGEVGTIKFNSISGKLEIAEYDKIPMALPPELTQCHDEYYTDEKHNLRYAMQYFKDLIDGKVESNIDTAIKITRILGEID